MKPSSQTIQDTGISPSEPGFSYISVIAAARIERAIFMQHVLARFSRWVGRGLIAPFATMNRRQRVYTELMSLDDRVLADIGITRGDIPCLASDCANFSKAGNDNGAKAA